MLRQELERFTKELTAVQPGEVSIGYRSVRVFSVEELAPEQVGYSCDPAGGDLTGDRDGDWKKSWLVIGHEDHCGDAIFVDVSPPKLPVYTAMHGMGEWNPILIADSFAGFLQALEAVSKLSTGRSNPVQLKAMPLTSAERLKLVESLKCLGPEADLDFWIDWFDA